MKIVEPILPTIDYAQMPISETFKPIEGFFSKSYTFNSERIATINSVITNLFESYSKVMPVRVDFYLKEEFAHQYGYKQLQKWFSQLRNNSRNNQLFSYLVTYISRLEYAKKTGWHFHIVFFFNGQLVQDDIYYANELCRYWEKVITKGQGRAHSPNISRIHQSKWQSADKSKRYALGRYINYFDSERIFKLRQACYYLAKITGEDTEAVSKIHPFVRLFNTGQIPTLDADLLWKRSGPPRKKSIKPYNPELQRQLEMMRKVGYVPYKETMIEINLEKLQK